MEATPKRIPDWALWVACVLPLLGFWTYGLTDLDEGFYGAVVMDMLRRHDWITPTLNGTPWFEKPILAYWLAMPSVQVFGEAIGPRLPSVLCTLATAVVLYRFVKRNLNETTARLVVLVYSTNLLVVAIGRMMMTDAPLVLCLTLALTTFWESLQPQGAKRLRLWSAVFIGLGVLAKGPVAAVLFIAVAGLAYWRLKELRPNFREYWLAGLGLCVASLALWYVPCYLANGDAFVQKFLIEQNVGRFAGGDKAHALPSPWLHPVYYPAVLLLTLLPWVVFSGRTVLTSIPTQEGQGQGLGRYLWVWFLVPLAFFTLSGTKLPHYALPAVPPLAVLIGAALLRARPGWRWESVGLAWAACVLVVAQAVFSAQWRGRAAEVQAAAKFASGFARDLVVYRVGREGPPSTGSLKLDETSHPSVFFYFLQRPDRRGLETASREAVLESRLPAALLTKPGLWTVDDQRWLASQGLSSVREDPHLGVGYEVWRIDRAAH